MPRRSPQHARRHLRPDRRARATASDVEAVLREIPGPDPVRDRRHPGGPRLPPATLLPRAVRDLLPLPRNRGRVFRLCPGADPAPGTLADLRPRPAGRRPAESVLGERRPTPRHPARDSVGARRRIISLSSAYAKSDIIL